jgi:anti-sigma regulatory factor (Ser/Thr protein kinase)
VVHFAADHGFAECSLGDIENAVGEALANAAEHGHCQDGEIGVHAYVEGQALVIDIEDRGAGFDTSRAAGDMRPSPTASRGFGIFLMRELMDGVEFDDSGARVRLVKRLPLDG